MSTLIETYLELTRYITETGEIINKETVKGNSLVKGWIRLLTQYLLQKTLADGLVITDTGGVDRSSQWGSLGTMTGTNVFSVKSGLGLNTHGVVVGSSNSGVTFDDTKLGIQIANGITAGALEHSASVGVLPTPVGSGLRIVADRSFSNGSPGNVTVRETGMYVRAIVDVLGVARYVCIARDTLSDQVIAPGQSLNIQYRIDSSLT